MVQVFDESDIQFVCDSHIVLFDGTQRLQSDHLAHEFDVLFEIGSANNSPSLRYFPFENFVTNISILYTSEFVFAFFGQQAEVHRTVNVGTLNMKSAEVNGTKPKSLRTWYGGNSYKEQPDRINPARLKESYIKVFSSSRGAKGDARTPRSKAEYDFAAVDVREKLCYPTPPEKANSEFIQAKHTPQRQKPTLTNEHPPFGARKKR